jgi:drug/metabolite transporter (DMT)-like permease
LFVRGGRATLEPESHDAQAYTAADWARVAIVALLWGTSFLFIDIGVDHFAPEIVAFARIALGAATLAAFPAARRAIPRADWGQVALLGVTWMAIPFVLFPIAEQWVDSSLAGMINGAAPLFTAAVAAIAVRQLPGRFTAVGLAIGFAGVLVVSSPALHDPDANAAGVALLLLATLLYGIAFNLAAPLQRRHGSLPVLLRAQLVALVLTAPLAATGVDDSSFSWEGALAMVALGCGGTAVAFVAFATLAGRVGSTRASVTIYLLPPVAIAAGALFRDEAIGVSALIGTALVLAGAAITSRGVRAPAGARATPDRTGAGPDTPSPAAGSPSGSPTRSTARR